jgi:hypothetical protein
MNVGLHVKNAVFFSDVNQYRNVPKDFSKNFKYKISWQSFRLKSLCFTRSDITMLKVVIFVKTPENHAWIDLFFSEKSYRKNCALFSDQPAALIQEDSSSFCHAVLHTEGRPSLLITAAGDTSGGVAEEFLKGAHDQREGQSQAFTQRHDESGTFKGAISLTH